MALLPEAVYDSDQVCVNDIKGNRKPKSFVPYSVKRLFKINKNRRKAIFNWAAKGLFVLRGGGGYIHSGYHKTLSATIACNRISCETET